MPYFLSASYSLTKALARANRLLLHGRNYMRQWLWPLMECLFLVDDASHRSCSDHSDSAAGCSTTIPNHPRMRLFVPVRLRIVERRLRASDLALISYHPLGTCKMGRDRRTSVVNLDHEAHDVPGLFVVDGSTVPGPPGVNPQLTIMALAVRAAEQIAKRLD